MYSQNARSTEFPLCKNLDISTFTWMQIEATSEIRKINITKDREKKIGGETQKSKEGEK